jgi:O-succinylbenzoic acid--CoA ligase
MAEIRCPVSEAAQTSLHEPAIITGDRKIIYSEYDQYVSAGADRLRKAGCVPSNRVALLLSNSWQVAVLIMALIRIRAVACLVDPKKDASLIRQSLHGIHCDRMIATETLPGLNIMKPDDLISLLSETPESDGDRRLFSDQPATILWSSSRAVLHSYGNHYYGALGFNHNLRSSSGCRWLLLEPLHRMRGLQILFQSAVSGATVVMPETQESIPNAIERYGVTHLLLSPARLDDLLNNGFSMEKHSGIRAIVLNEPVPAELLRRSYELKLPVYRSYGLTEMASMVAVTSPDSPPAKRSTSGQVLKYRNVKIAADGEIMVKGQTLFQGYVEGSNVRPSVDGDGWFGTGDIGALDAEGYLTVLGRK